MNPCRAIFALLLIVSLLTRTPQGQAIPPPPPLLCQAGDRFIIDRRITILRALYEHDFRGFPVHADDRRFLEARHRQMPGRLFFEVENAVLKELNDVLFADHGGQGMSQAVQNVFKRIFFGELRNDTLLEPLVEYQYSDYKGIRLIFRSDTAEVRARLRQVYENATRRFAEVMELDPVVRSAITNERAHGLARNPRQWWMAGMAGQNGPQGNANAGMLMDQASLAARIARGSRNGNHFLDFNDPQVVRTIGEDLLTTETLRRQIQSQILERFGANSGILVEASPGVWVPSADTLDIMRRARTQPTQAAYIRYVRDRFRRRFGENIPESLITGATAMPGRFEGGLQRYFHHLNNYLVSLNVLHERFDGGNEVPHDLIAIDFQSQGARIGQQVAAALAEGAQVPLPHSRPAPNSVEEQNNHRARTLFSLRRARHAVDRSADDFARMRDRAVDLLHDLGVDGHPGFGENGFQREGDELRFASARRIPPGQVLALMERVARAGLPVRTVNVDTRFYHSDNLVPDTIRTSLESLGMRLIKDLADLEGNRVHQDEIPSAVFREYRYMVRFTPYADRAGGRVVLVLAGPDVPESGLYQSIFEGRIRQYLQENAPDFVFSGTYARPPSGPARGAPIPRPSSVPSPVGN